MSPPSAPGPSGADQYVPPLVEAVIGRDAQGIHRSSGVPRHHTRVLTPAFAWRLQEQPSVPVCITRALTKNPAQSQKAVLLETNFQLKTLKHQAVDKSCDLTSWVGRTEIIPHSPGCSTLGSYLPSSPGPFPSCPSSALTQWAQSSLAETGAGDKQGPHVRQGLGFGHSASHTWVKQGSKTFCFDFPGRKPH